MEKLTTFRFLISLGNFQVETAQSVSDLTYGQDVVEIKQMSASGDLIIHKQPGPRQSGEVTITRGLDKSQVFTDWVKKTLEDRDLDAARENVTITLLDAQGNPARYFHLSNAWASQWSGPGGMDASGADPATETVTLQYDDISVE
ncbi:phage tail protein [Streptomyces sp. NPDC004732]|uniref:phage tail protein n=1 Tax=Streptomyces sp. NPDC004732 TaxID=3154290 RepID=UPI0033A40089